MPEKKLAFILDKIGLQDAKALEYHNIITHKPNKHGKIESEKTNWKDGLWYYRNRTVHDYYITSLPETYPVLLSLSKHMQDLALRMMLKLLGYSGNYWSRIDSDEKDVDWVTASTTSRELGYK